MNTIIPCSKDSHQKIIEQESLATGSQAQSEISHLAAVTAVNCHFELRQCLEEDASRQRRELFADQRYVRAINHIYQFHSMEFPQIGIARPSRCRVRLA